MAIQMGGEVPSKNPKMKKPNHQLVLSNRCVETQAQIQNLIQVMGLTSSALQTHRPASFFSIESGDTPKQSDGPVPMTEGQIALENTLRAACERMEKILNNDSRWDDTFQRKVEDDYDKLHKLQMEMIDGQKAAAAEVTSPHFRYRPDLQRLQNGQWMAILGDAAHLEFAIYGIGDSAQQAMEEFDHVFRTGVPKSLSIWLERRAADIEAGREPQPFPNQEQNEKQNDDNTGEQMDGGGNATGSEPPKGR